MSDDQSAASLPTQDNDQEPQATAAARANGVDPAGERRLGGKCLRGATVSPGLVLGRAHRKDYNLSTASVERVALDEVDQELNRFRRSLDASKAQISELKSRLQGRVSESDARILDTHLTYLRDSVFIADVENLILNEQMRLDSAIAKVVGDFDRIFRLVKNATLRQSAVDLRDVGIRVLRNLEEELNAGHDGVGSPVDYILVAAGLSIVDMFNLEGEQVKGIVTEEGGMTSHAAIFARSMGIPTVIGISDLLEHVNEGDFLILDAAEATLQINPDELVRAQYLDTLEDTKPGPVVPAEIEEWAMRDTVYVEGEALRLSACCGNLPEVEHARESGLSEIGLYRTELLYLVDRTAPSLDALVHHYSSVISAARGAAVTFRLLNVDSSVGLGYLHAEGERNPALGRFGMRALLDNPVVLRRQLHALLMAGHGSEIRIVLPHLTDCGELRRVKEVLFEERIELRKKGERFQEKVAVGSTIAIPAAFLGVKDLAQESDFLIINLDSLQQYMMAADRENTKVSSVFDRLHPFLLRGLISIVEAAREADVPLSVHGVTARRAANVPLLVGAGLRHFSIPPSEYRAFLDALDLLDVGAVTASTLSAARSTCVEEMDSLVGKYQHGSPRL